MANLQVRDIDDKLYESIRSIASNEKRSISQEVGMMKEIRMNYLIDIDMV